MLAIMWNVDMGIAAVIVKAIMLVVVMVVGVAAALVIGVVIAANLHIIGCLLGIVAFGAVTYPKQPVKVVTL